MSDTETQKTPATTLWIDERRNEIIESVKSINSDFKDFRITDVKDPFLKGKLYTVNFKVEGDNEKDYWVRVYSVGSKKPEVFRHDEMLLNIIGQRFSETSFINKLLDKEIIPGTIAMIITILICYMVLTQGSNITIPDILSNALTIILGFYFGRSKSK